MLARNIVDSGEKLRLLFIVPRADAASGAGIIETWTPVVTAALGVPVFGKLVERDTF